MQRYDLVIIGSGPAAYSASIYASRYKINHILIGAMPGGTASSAHRICNYPGFEDITGLELMMKMQKQVFSYGAKEIMAKVISVSRNGNDFLVSCENDKEFVASCILVAVGTKRKKLGIPSEKTFEGKGISYCFTCDGMFYKGEDVAVVGGAGAANMAAAYLSELAKKVYVIHRKDKLCGEQLWIDEVMRAKNIEVVFNANIVEFLGNESLRGVRLDKNGIVLDVSGVFIEIGSDPTLDFNLDVELDDNGYIVVDQSQKTNLDGIFAAGDITTNSNGLQQVITACSEGAVAINSIYVWLKNQK